MDGWMVGWLAGSLAGEVIDQYTRFLPLFYLNYLCLARVSFIDIESITLKSNSFVCSGIRMLVRTYITRAALS